MGLLEALGITKQVEASLDDQANEVRSAWRAATGNDDSSWVEEVYADHVVVCANGAHYSVPYASDAAGITFDGAGATEVERTWIEVTKTVVISKVDEDRQLAFGWAYVYEKDGERVVDHSGEFIEKGEVEDAAYEFNMLYREGDEVHTEPIAASLVESFVSTPEKLVKMGLDADALPHGWWTGWYVPDPEVFAKIKTGEYEMLSIGGTAVREAVDA